MLNYSLPLWKAEHLPYFSLITLRASDTVHFLISKRLISSPRKGAHELEKNECLWELGASILILLKHQLMFRFGLAYQIQNCSVFSLGNHVFVKRNKLSLLIQEPNVKIPQVSVWIVVFITLNCMDCVCSGLGLQELQVQVYGHEKG